MRRLALLTGLALALAAPPTADASRDAPFGHQCVPAQGVRFCQTANEAQRVHSFDGFPLDVDVTLPPTGNGPFPTIVMLHGYPGSKRSQEASTFEGNGSATFHWNNVFYAAKGYAVVNYSARGFGGSCGPQLAATPECAGRWLHFADQRFEVRDTQHLLGLLVDEGVADPDALGVTGESYGGGQSMQLALLRNRIRRTSGRLAAWMSPAGRRLSIAAAFSRWGWHDFTYAGLPNGRFLDFAEPDGIVSQDPVGVPKEGVLTTLYTGGRALANLAPPGVDPTADLQLDLQRVLAGEPTTRVGFRHLRDFTLRKSAAGIDVRRAAPLLIQNGWPDTIFPPEEGIQAYNRLREENPRARVALQFGDVGHFRPSNVGPPYMRLHDDALAFFDQYLKGEGHGPARGSVTAFGVGCPKGTPGFGPIVAPSYSRLANGAFRLTSFRARTIKSAGGPADVALALEGTRSGNNPCVQLPEQPTASGTAVLERGSSGFRLLGLPTVEARVDTDGSFGELTARLWDVRPDGTQRIVTHGVYRLRDDQEGVVRFQMLGSGYEFPEGDTVKVEILGRDPPSFRASNTTFKVRISEITVELPTRERPGGHPGIVRREFVPFH